MFVTNWISTTKIQKISEITNFFRHYFLSRTEVGYWIHLAHSLRPVDAHHQPNSDRLRPPMVPAPHLHADQYLITFAMLTFVVFSVVLFIYNKVVFAIFLLGSILYGGWMALFLQRRKVLDYELFEQQAINNNRTYEFITSMQEIKLQDCEQRKRKEWEETQVNLFRVQQKSLKLQQTQ